MTSREYPLKPAAHYSHSARDTLFTFSGDASRPSDGSTLNSQTIVLEAGDVNGDGNDVVVYRVSRQRLVIASLR